MLRPAFRLQPDGDVGDMVVEAGESSQEVDGEGARRTLHIHRELMGARRRLSLDDLDLLQQVVHGQDFIFRAPHWTGANAGDLLQVPSGMWRTG